MSEQNIEISTNKDLLNVTFIHQFISGTYWAKGRSIEDVQTCINNSLNFGVYLNGLQIGYARVVTDYIIFAYLMDVFIDKEFRKKGYSKLLMKYIMQDNALKHIKVWRLATTDAHALYEQYGFERMKKPENLMEKIHP